MALTVNVKKIFDARYHDVSEGVPVDGSIDVAQVNLIGAAPSSYDVAVVSGTAQALNNLTGQIDYTGADVSVVLNSILSGWGPGAYGGTIDVVPPTSGALPCSQLVKIPVDLTTFLLRVNGAVLQPSSASTGGLIAPLRRSTTLGASLANGATSITLASVPAWVNPAGGYVNVGSSLWHYTAVSGVTLTGAAQQNGETSTQSNGTRVTNPYETWQNIEVRDLVIDAVNMSGSGSTGIVLVGTGQLGATLFNDNRLNINNLRMNCGRVLNALGNPSTGISCLSFKTRHTRQQEAIANRIDDVYIEDWVVGGIQGVTVAGNSSQQADATHDVNIQYGDVRIRRCRFDAGTVPTAAVTGQGFLVGGQATGDKTVVFEDLRSRNSNDVCGEIDNARRAEVTRMQTRDAYNYGMLFSNFNKAPSDQSFLVRDYKNEMVSLNNALGVQIGLGWQVKNTHQFGRIEVTGRTEFYRTGNKINPQGWDGIRLSDSSSITFDSMVIDGHVSMLIENAVATSDAAGHVSTVYLNRVTGRVYIPGRVSMDARTGNSVTGGTSLGVSAIRADTAGSLYLDGQGPRIQSVWNDVTDGTTRAVLVNAGVTVSGRLRAGSIGQTTDAGNTYGDFTPVGVWLASTATIGTKLKTPDWDYSEATTLYSANSIPGGQASKFETDPTGAIISGSGGASFKMRSTAIAETFSRSGSVMNNGQVISTGTLRLVAIELLAGQIINQIVFLSGGTAGSGMSHQWFCLADSSLVMLATTTDDTSTAWSTNSEKALAISQVASGSAASYTIPTDGLYYVGCMVEGTTPTLFGNQSSGTSNGLAPILAGQSTAALHGPPSFPTTFSSITADGKEHWAWVA